MYSRRVNARGIIFKSGTLLCQQLKPDSNGTARDFWCTPGGGLELGESLHQGLYREMIEETGVAPKIGKLLFIQQFHDGEQEQLEFFFHIENPQDYLTIDLSATSHGDLEINNVEFVVPSQHNVLPAFLQTTDIQNYIDNPRPVLITSELKNV